MDDSLLILPKPIDASPGLLGERGEFRNLQGPRILAAENDLEAVGLWLKRPNLSPATRRNYHKEATRLLLWAWHKKNKALSSLTYEDYIAYKEFLENPELSWVSHRSKKESQLHRFEGPLKERSVKAALVTILAMLNWLVKKRYLITHPLEGDAIGELVRSRDILDERSVARSLNINEWTLAINVLYQMAPRGSERRNQAKYEQARFIVLAYYALGARLSELASHTMNSFYSLNGNWKWYVRGKGNKSARVALNSQFLKALVRYRQFHRMPPYPDPNDNSPIVLSIYGKKGVTARRIHQILKETFNAIANTLEAQDQALAIKLRALSTHWLRHTAVSHLGEKHTPIYHMQDFARHSDPKTTMIYQHTDDAAEIETAESLVIPAEER